jgi:PIN domain nuclease of toxin-antitoxin system
VTPILLDTHGSPAIFLKDPADRIIAATANVHGATLLTADDRLLDWPGRLARHDARR